MLALPGAAAAQTTIGQTLATTTDATSCNNDTSRVQVSSAVAPAFEVPPGNWLLASWSTRARSGPGQSMKLKVFRPLGDPVTADYGVVGDSGLTALVPSALNLFVVNPPIPVQGGDRLGMVPKAGAVECTFSVPVAGDVQRLAPSTDPAPGTTVPFAGPANQRLNLSATLFPVPTSPADTDAPDTEITKAPKKKSRKGRATFEFRSEDPAASFECRLDDQQFAACTSPGTYKVKPGKHSFEVRAVDAAGNPDPIPAEESFQRKRKR